jgi:hypothetical protein
MRLLQAARARGLRSGLAKARPVNGANSDGIAL